MGSEDFYPEERPVHRVSVDGFWMDETPVTAVQFRRFVRVVPDEAGRAGWLRQGLQDLLRVGQLPVRPVRPHLLAERVAP